MRSHPFRHGLARPRPSRCGLWAGRSLRSPRLVSRWAGAGDSHLRLRRLLYNEPRSGSGTWDDDDWEGQSSVTVSFEGDRVSSTYEALRDGKTLKLWTYVGDPDEGHSLCILTLR